MRKEELAVPHLLSKQKLADPAGWSKNNFTLIKKKLLCRRLEGPNFVLSSLRFY